MPSGKPVGISDVIGPSSSTNQGVTTFNGITGRKLRNTNVVIGPSNEIDIPGWIDMAYVPNPGNPGITRRRLIVKSSPFRRFIAIDDNLREWDLERNPNYLPEQSDDFIHGYKMWSILNGSFIADNSQQDHPGVIKMASTSVINEVTMMYPHNDYNVPLFRFDEVDYVRWIINNIDASFTDYTIRFGIAREPQSQLISNGAYFEHLKTDTNFWFVTKNNTAETRVNTNFPFGFPNWFNLFFKVSSGSNSIDFYINHVFRGITSLNIPGGSTGMIPFIQIIPTGIVGASRRVLVDLFQLRLKEVTR